MPLEVDLGSITTDFQEVVRELKYDLRDEWYPDSLGYEDMLSPEGIAEGVKNSIEANNGLFMPEPRKELNIPKRGFVLRYSLETCLFDRAYYHSLVRYLAPLYDTLLPNQVLSHRYASQGDRAGRYLFLHPIEQWKLFSGYVAQEINAKPVVLVTDVQNYFENIQIDRLANTLRNHVPSLNIDGAEKARVRNVINDLERCLKTWCYSDTHGLPQNRDASSFLANIVMLAVDEVMLRRGYTYYRYMDDIRIATSSRYEARKALQELIVELRALGLNVNPGKTAILEPEMPEYAKMLSESEPELEQIDNMWKSRSLPVIRRSFEPLQRLSLRLIQEQRTQDRAFRFCIKRFENVALCAEIDTPATFFEPLIAVAINELDTHPCTTDQLVRFLKASPISYAHLISIADFLKDNVRAIYDWQNYLLWQLLVYKGYRDNALIAVARNRIDNTFLEADRAGAMLYLGAMGSGEDRQLLVQRFQHCNHHLLQRNAIIAVHELEYRQGIDTHVAPHVLPSLKGTYRGIREKHHGCYHRPLPTVSYLDIYDEVTSYE